MPAAPTQTALKTRLKVFETLRPYAHHRFPSVMLEDALLDVEGDVADHRWARMLASGVVRFWFYLPHVIQPVLSGKWEALSPDVQLLLRLGAYQLIFVDAFPAAQVVDTTVRLAKQVKLSPRLTGLVNAVLRKLAAQADWPDWSEPSAALLFPDWWVQRLSQRLSAEHQAQIAQVCTQPPQFSIRANRLKADRPTLQALLKAHGVDTVENPTHPDVLTFTQAMGKVNQLPGYPEGLFVVQDAASACVAEALNPQSGETILEIGAAPGTKTTHLAALMKDQGIIFAVDHHSERIKRVEENCLRLGLQCVQTLVADATQPIQGLPEQVDRILLDAPCSGTGVIRKHPDILLRLKDSDFTTLAKTQLQLLETAWPRLKSGGKLVYSTCSIDAAENQDVMTVFQAKTPDIAELSWQHLWPQPNHDGFFIAVLTKQ